MTESGPSGNRRSVQASSANQRGLGDPQSAGAARAPAPTFEAVYDGHFEFVSKMLRRLGVPDHALDDALQDLFVVVHRRLGEFEGRSSLKTWLARIAVHVAADHRRSRRRKGQCEPLEESVADRRADPFAAAQQTESVDRLYRILARLEESHREVFVLAELEQMTAPEIAEALELKLNTVYSRLRAARQRFDAALEADERGDR